MSFLNKLLTIAAISLLITACSKGSGSNSDPVSSSTTTSSVTTVSSTDSQTQQTNSNTQAAPQAPTPAPVTQPDPAPAPSTTSVTLSWTPPTQRDDSSSLPTSEIASYQIIYYLDDPLSTSEVGQVVQVSQSSAQSSGYQHTLELSSGRYVFAISCTDTNGNASDISSEVVIEV